MLTCWPYAPWCMGPSRDPRLRPEAEEAWAGKHIQLHCHDLRTLVHGPLPRPEASAGGRGGSGIEAGHHPCLGNKASRVMGQRTPAGCSLSVPVRYAFTTQQALRPFVQTAVVGVPWLVGWASLITTQQALRPFVQTAVVGSPWLVGLRRSHRLG